ncbi:MAG TPA: S41 family peptidase [Thermomicrobiales bacterium]|nr:S41 family peptidase [Thermomicrobiales bacterium]
MLADARRRGQRPAPRPFAGAGEVAVVLPRDGAALGEGGARALADLAALLWRERAELAVELGAPVAFVATDPGAGPRWLLGPAAANPDLARYSYPRDGRARLWLDRAQGVLIADAPDLGGVRETLNLLRTLALDGVDEVVAADCRDREEAIARLAVEVGRTYPAFALRRLDWAAIRARHADRARAAGDLLPALQAWLAELQDAHTWVKPSPAPVSLPYAVRVDGDTATFARVPPGTAAWEAGVRPGDALLDADAAGWWARTGAPAHARALMAGYRLLAGPVGVARTLTTRSPRGEVRTWTEAPAVDPPYPLVSWRRLSSGTGYLRVESWHPGRPFADALDAAFADLAACGRLIVDLRGNVGGNLVAALAFRDRFLHRPTVCGSVRFSDGTGGLAPPAEIAGEPASERARWRGDVRFLTDPLTYSASEDALLGLQGLPHVRVVGEPSGGGSGRPRALRLLPGLQLTVSTALTFDRLGRCVEGAGIPVDLPVAPARPAPDAPDTALLAAERSW